MDECAENVQWCFAPPQRCSLELLFHPPYKLKWLKPMLISLEVFSSQKNKYNYRVTFLGREEFCYMEYRKSASPTWLACFWPALRTSTEKVESTHDIKILNTVKPVHFSLGFSDLKVYCDTSSLKLLFVFQSILWFVQKPILVWAISNLPHNWEFESELNNTVSRKCIIIDENVFSWFLWTDIFWHARFWNSEQNTELRLRFECIRLFSRCSTRLFSKE